MSCHCKYRQIQDHGNGIQPHPFGLFGTYTVKGICYTCATQLKLGWPQPLTGILYASECSQLISISKQLLPELCIYCELYELTDGSTWSPSFQLQSALLFGLALFPPSPTPNSAEGKEAAAVCSPWAA